MNLTTPRDVEDALRRDLAPYMTGTTVCAQPAPDALAAKTVCIVALGGGSATPVSYEHDLVAYAWDSTPGDAIALANTVCGLLGSMPLRASAAGVTYTTCDVDAPYLDPDPDRPTLPRATVRATIGVRGVATTIN